MVYAANKEYYALGKLFKSKSLSRQPKESIDLCFLLQPVLTYLYAWETSLDTEGDEENMFYFERRVLRRIYRPIPKYGAYRIITNRKI